MREKQKGFCFKQQNKDRGSAPKNHCRLNLPQKRISD